MLTAILFQSVGIAQNGMTLPLSLIVEVRGDLGFSVFEIMLTNDMLNSIRICSLTKMCHC